MRVSEEVNMSCQDKPIYKREVPVILEIPTASANEPSPFNEEVNTITYGTTLEFTRTTASDKYSYLKIHPFSKINNYIKCIFYKLEHGNTSLPIMLSCGLES